MGEDLGVNKLGSVRHVGDFLLWHGADLFLDALSPLARVEVDRHRASIPVIAPRVTPDGPVAPPEDADHHDQEEDPGSCYENNLDPVEPG